jgi:hypothetical protein
MSKLTLELDALQVESFATTAAEQRRGTVAAHAGTDYTVCWGLCGSETDGSFCGGGDFTAICDTEYTNCGDRTCAETCNSCNASCAGIATYCQDTCIDRICLATQPPFCEM